MNDKMLRQRLRDDAFHLYGDISRVLLQQQRLFGPENVRRELLALSRQTLPLMELSNSLDIRHFHTQLRHLERHFRYLCQGLPNRPFIASISSARQVLEATQRKVTRLREIREAQEELLTAQYNASQQLRYLECESEFDNQSWLATVQEVKGRIQELATELLDLDKNRSEAIFLGVPPPG